jgi:hypothetical protein
MSAAFIGIVYLAIVGGAAESGSAVAMAHRNTMDLAVGIALGSRIQIGALRRADAGARELPRGAAAPRVVFQPARDRVPLHGHP